MTNKSKHATDLPRGMRFCALCCECRPKSQFYLSPFCSGELFPICERHLTEQEADARVQKARAVLARAGIRPGSPLTARLADFAPPQNLGTP